MSSSSVKSNRGDAGDRTGAFHMQSERSTTELHPLGLLPMRIHHKWQNTSSSLRLLPATIGEGGIAFTSEGKNLPVPTGGLEPPIFGLGDRRLIH